MTELARQRQIEIENKLNGESITYEFYSVDEAFVRIEVLWGDWKHEHPRLKHLMKEIGWEHWGSVTTEEDGGDCYSAVHTFVYSH